MQYLITSLFCLLLFFSCEKEALEDPAITSATLPVVEAYLVAGQTAQVELRQQVPFEAVDSLDLPLTGLAPQLFSEGVTYDLSETTPGVYTADTTWRIQAGQTYELRFVYADRDVTAITTIPFPPRNFSSSASSITFESSSFPPSIPDPIELTWDAVAGSYYLVRVENIESNPVELSSLGGGGGGGERPVMVTVPEQVNTYSLRPRDFQYLGTTRIVLTEVTIDYVVLAQETSSADAQNLTEPFSNIEGGTGIFTGAGTDTLFIEVRD
ncbi:MAG: DUF4249 family protein [Bacteroidota bacterium]